MQNESTPTLNFDPPESLGLGDLEIAGWRTLLNSASRRIVVAGLDTEVGKTYISGLLLNWLAEQGMRPGYLKPVESGCDASTGRLQSAELASILQLAKDSVGTRVASVYRFEPPVAPAMAADRAGTVIQMSRIRDNLQELEKKSDVVLIEGAGGLYSPLSWDLDTLDLALALDAALLIVIPNKLGCIGLARMLVRSLPNSLPANRVHLILNNVDPDVSDVSRMTNHVHLNRVLPQPMLTQVQFGAEKILG